MPDRKDRTTKRCSGCREVQPVENFHRDCASKDGKTGRCKACAAAHYRSNRERVLEKSAAWYAKNKARKAATAAKWRAANQPRIRAAAKARKDANPGKSQAATERWRKANPGRSSAYGARHRARYPERAKARDAVGNAIKAGKLKRGPCEVCGIEPKRVNGRSVVEAHHEDYSKPLAVRWLCHYHHRQVEGRTG